MEVKFSLHFMDGCVDCLVTYLCFTYLFAGLYIHAAVLNVWQVDFSIM